MSESPSDGPAICGIIVSYRPAESELQAMLDAALPQLDGLVVVDNSPEGPDQEVVQRAFDRSKASAPDRPVELQSFHENRGLSKGLNAGLRAARLLGFDCRLLLDQDSLLAPEAVNALRAEYRHRGGGDRPVLVAAQNYLTGPSGVHQLLERYLYGYRPLPGPSRSGRLALTSGLLVDARVLERCGGFDESLFVDSVDHEFSLRAREAGIPLWTVPTARIQHRLGDPEVVHGPLIGTSLRYRSEDRLYYGTRDTLRTVRRHVRRSPLLATVLGGTAVLRLMAYRAAGPSGEAQYRAARRGVRDFLREPDEAQIPRLDPERSVPA